MFGGKKSGVFEFVENSAVISREEKSAPSPSIAE
jgi:hypothetical protein